MTPRGRFAPSPSGRMHMGNICAALASWLSVRKAGGLWVLRIEDLDPQRSKIEHARMIEDDLHWLGLDWDEGGLDGLGPNGPYVQSQRGEIYQECLNRLIDKGLVYRCHCTRADIMATQAPHQSDGRIVYAGTCRPAEAPPFPYPDGRGSLRLYVPQDVEISFTDVVYGLQNVNVAEHCGDFILQRADGAWAYQLAVVVDDALMGITEVVRGCDLLLSTAQQIHLFNLLWPDREHVVPEYAHMPLICNEHGQRLSKRDQSMSMAELRRHFTPAEVIGQAAKLLGIWPSGAPVSPSALIPHFAWHNPTY